MQKYWRRCWFFCSADATTGIQNTNCQIAQAGVRRKPFSGIRRKWMRSRRFPKKTVQVYICGAVASPGVYTLPGGSRVVQAVEAAGGFLPDAEEKILNLARKIEDGEQITVWTREEAENMESTETPQQNTGGTEQASGSGKVKN